MSARWFPSAFLSTLSDVHRYSEVFAHVLRCSSMFDECRSLMPVKFEMFVDFRIVDFQCLPMLDGRRLDMFVDVRLTPMFDFRRLSMFGDI